MNRKIIESGNTFKRAERLKSRSLIGQLFQGGKSFGQYPLRLIWIEIEKKTQTKTYPVQFALSVPKKKFPKASQRNYLKRKIREAYRLNKGRLYHKLQQQEKQYAWMVLYVGKEPLSYAEIDRSMKRIIGRFVKTIKKSAKNE